MKKISVVIEALNIDFETAASKCCQIRFRHGISFLRNNLERSFDSEFIIEIHGAATEVAASGCFDVVGHHGAGGFSFRPEPDEWKPVDLLRLHYQMQKFFVEDIHASI